MGENNSILIAPVFYWTGHEWQKMKIGEVVDMEPTDLIGEDMCLNLDAVFEACIQNGFSNRAWYALVNDCPVVQRWRMHRRARKLLTRRKKEGCRH